MTVNSWLLLGVLLAVLTKVTLSPMISEVHYFCQDELICLHICCYEENVRFYSDTNYALQFMTFSM